MRRIKMRESETGTGTQISGVLLVRGGMGELTERGDGPSKPEVPGDRRPVLDGGYTSGEYFGGLW